MMAAQMEEHLPHTVSTTRLYERQPQHLVVRCSLRKDQPHLVLTQIQFLGGTLQDIPRSPRPSSKCPVTMPSLWQKWNECETRSGSQVPHSHPW